MGQELIGRTSEVLLLEQMLLSNRPEFLALYGRRRVGKTFLIREFFKKKKVCFFYVTGTQNGTLSEQIRHFTRELSHVFYEGAPLENKKTWDETLEQLTLAIQKESKKRKIVLFLDELPWLSTRNSRLLQSLEYYWNRHWSNDERIKLIVCGSSASWIIRKIVNNKGGLHNRVTLTMRLNPFNLYATKQFLMARNIKLSNRHILQIYMVTGGVPYYLSRIEKGLSASQIIDSLVFGNENFLLKEFDNLFSSLFDEYKSHVEILRIISENRYGISQESLLKKLDGSLQGQGGLDKLHNLEDAGFIVSFKPHFHKKRGKYYRINDEYTLFYFYWLESLRNTLQENSIEPGIWKELQNTPAWNTWIGLAFETICYKHIPQIRKKLALSPTAIANSWRYIPRRKTQESGAQIDLLFDRSDDSITLCEIKYSKDPFQIDKAYAKILAQKKEVFIKRTKTRKQLFMAMITTHGLKENFYAEEFIQNIVTLDDLFLENEQRGR